jgi:hypothetical protein
MSGVHFLALPLDADQAHQHIQSYDADGDGVPDAQDAAPKDPRQAVREALGTLLTRQAAPTYQMKPERQQGDDWSRDLMHAVTKDGGFTFHDHVGDGPSGGYMVSVDKHGEETVPIKDLTPGRVADYMSVHQQDLKDPHNYLGGWVYKGKVFLDVSRNVADRNEAMRLGDANSQLGIYDLNSGQTVLTNYGTRRQQGGQQAAASLEAGRGGNRTCDSCGGAIPHRTHRQRNGKGELVCDSCAGFTTKSGAAGDNPHERTCTNRRCVDYGLRVPADHQHHVVATSAQVPGWNVSHSSLDEQAKHEMRRREAEALVSIARVRQGRMTRVAHDTGDNAILNHCPFCGSGAVVRNSDNSTSCDFCHNTFTVQVQPAHPYLPQTVDGQPSQMPGMPGDQPTEISGSDDPTVEEEAGEEDVAADPLGDADPTSNGPVAPGAAPSKQPPPPGNPPSSPKDPDKSGKPPWLKDKKKSYRTASGAVVDEQAYLAHLALALADDRAEVLDSVRMANLQREAGTPTFIMGNASGKTCTSCGKKIKQGERYTKPTQDTVAHQGACTTQAKTAADAAQWVEGEGGSSASEYFMDPSTNSIAVIEQDYETPGWFAGVGDRTTGEVHWVSDRAMPKEEAKALALSQRTAAVERRKAEIKASEIQVGDRLDISGKTRVAQRHPRTDKVLVQIQTTGTRSPSVAQWENDEPVTVWR